MAENSTCFRYNDFFAIQLLSEEALGAVSLALTIPLKILKCGLLQPIGPFST